MIYISCPPRRCMCALLDLGNNSGVSQLERCNWSAATGAPQLKPSVYAPSYGILSVCSFASTPDHARTPQRETLAQRDSDKRTTDNRRMTVRCTLAVRNRIVLYQVFALGGTRIIIYCFARMIGGPRS